MLKKDGKWFIETRTQRMEGGGSCETTEKVRVLSRENGKRIIEAVVLTDTDIDRSGNISTNRGKGYHYVTLMDGKKQLSFAIDFIKVSLGWRVLSDDCISFVQDVETKTAAIELLTIASTQSNARTSDEIWKQEPIPSEEEIRAEQGEAEATDKRDAELQTEEEDFSNDFHQTGGGGERQ